MAGWSLYPILVTGFKHQDDRADQITSKDPSTTWVNSKPRSVAPNDYNIRLIAVNDFVRLVFDRVITTNSYCMFAALHLEVGASLDIAPETAGGVQISEFRVTNAGLWQSQPNRIADIAGAPGADVWAWVGIASYAHASAGNYRLGVGGSWEVDIQGVDTQASSSTDVQSLRFTVASGSDDIDIETVVLCVPAIRYSSGDDTGAAHPPTSGTLAQGGATARIIGTHPDDSETDSGWILLDTIDADFTVGGGDITVGSWTGTLDTELTEIPDDTDFVPELFAEMGTVVADVSNTLTPSAGATAYEVLDDVSTADYATATTPAEQATMELTDIAGIGDPYFYGLTAVSQVDGAVITSLDTGLQETVSGDVVTRNHTPGAAYVGNTISIGTKPKTADRLTQAEVNSLRVQVKFN